MLGACWQRNGFFNVQDNHAGRKHLAQSLAVIAEMVVPVPWYAFLSVPGQPASAHYRSEMFDTKHLYSRQQLHLHASMTARWGIKL